MARQGKKTAAPSEQSTVQSELEKEHVTKNEIVV
jgi:hypothetical protein